MTVSVDLAIVGGVLAVVTSVVSIITAARRAARHVAREVAIALIETHGKECPVRDEVLLRISDAETAELRKANELREASREREERWDRRLVAIEVELRDLNRYLRNHKGT